jgi:transmembrane sensor
VDRIKELILKHIRLEISEPEEIELQAWLNQSERNRHLFIEIMNPEELSKSFRKLDNLHKSAVWERIKDYSENHDLPLHKELVTTFGSRLLRMISGNRKWWAAAAVLIGVSFGTYFLVRNQKITQPAVAVVPSKTDIAPGGNRAILTLGNGSKIILDSTQNGFIAQQGNTKIIKTDSGRLTYNPSSDASAPFSYNTMTTPRGGQYQLVLSDGTKVWLNAASSITYPISFVGSQRKVSITGEAYFEVVHNAAKPFLVSVNNMDVEVTGTHFNINAYADETSMNTTLLEGSVRVSWNNQKKILKPGQQSQAASNGVSIIENADLDYVMAWKNGEMELANGDVKKLFREISRWYDVDVEYHDGIPEGQFAASIKRNLPLSNLLRVLDTYGVQTQLENNKIVVQ